MVCLKKNINPIVGIDLSLNGTGIAYILKNNIYTKQIPFKGSELKLSHGERFCIIARKIKEVINRILLNDNSITAADIEILIEQVPFNIGKNKTGHNTLVELHGAIKMMLFEEFNKIPDYVNVSSWKKEIIGNGKASKEEIKESVIRNWNVNLSTFDEYDAFCVLQYAIKKLGKINENKRLEISK